MDLNEAIEVLVNSAMAFVNNSLYGEYAHNHMKYIEEAEEVVRKAVIKEQAVTVGNYEI